MHTFEAALFMIGYDVACIQCHSAETKEQRVESAESFQESAEEPDVVSSVTIYPLSGQGDDITFSGSLEAGFSVRSGNVRFFLSPGQLSEIQAESGGRTRIHLGGSRTNPPNGSFGAWLV